MVTRLVLVRHGETLANREFRYIGSRDDALSEVGREQARLLGEALAQFPIAGVYSSPLQRARQTAEMIAQKHQQPCQEVMDLREGRFGIWEGMSRAEVLARSAEDKQQLLAWERDPESAPPGGESFAQVQARVLNVVEQLVARHPQQSIVLVSHVGPIKVLLCHALGAPLTSMFNIFLDPATISIVDWRERPLVRLLNSHAHLGWGEARWLQ